MISNKLLTNYSNDYDYAQKIVDNDFCFINGKDLAGELNLSHADIEDFQGHWEDLRLDNYMKDGGVYRYRKYSQLNRLSQDKILKLLPHEPYTQPSYINSLNGNVQRLFEPMGEEFIKCNAMNKVLCFIQKTMDEIKGSRLSWNIRLHPYRIVTKSDSPGLPTPEGLHRDGVDYICTLMLKRKDIKGGVTTITNSVKAPIKKIILERPLDLMIADDNRTMHEVSPIVSNSNTCNGYRDVLVVAFTLI